MRNPNTESSLRSQDPLMGHDLLASRKLSSPSQPNLGDSFARTAMPSHEHYPLALDSQYYWSPQSPYGDRSVAVPTMEALDWPFYPSTAVSCPGPPAYNDDSGSFLDNAVNTPSLDGSTQETPWDCQSTDETTLNTPTSPFSYSFNVQDSDNLKIMLSGSPKTQVPYLSKAPCTQSPRTYPPYLLGPRDYRKRQRESGSVAKGSLLEEISRSSCPPMQRAKVELSPDPEADATMDFGDGNAVGTPNGDETDGEGGANSEPYAQLIYRALMSAPNHAMVLKDIYEWFEQNTDKAKIAPSSSAKGWQNSIRHNLSMNGAFQKVEQIPPAEDCKKGFIWVLADSALQDGVKSTTRYRKQNANKKGSKTDHPAPQRQISGAKGGKAAKKSAANATKMAASKLRRTVRPGKLSPPFFGDSQTGSHLSATEELSVPQQIHQLPYRSDNSPYYQHTPTSTPLLSSSEPRSFDYGEIVGCTPDIDGPLFYDVPLDSASGAMLSSQGFPNREEHLLGYQFDGALPH